MRDPSAEQLNNFTHASLMKSATNADAAPAKGACAAAAVNDEQLLLQQDC